MALGSTAAIGRATLPLPSWRRSLQTSAVYIAVVVVALFLLFWALTPGNVFIGHNNLVSIGLGSAELILLTAAATYVIASANIDLSLGANLVLSSIVGGKVILAIAGTRSQVVAGIYPRGTLAIAVGALAAIATGTAMGWLNGILITRLRVNAFVITLGTMGIGTGLANVLTNGTNIAYLPLTLQTDIGLREIGGVPLPMLLALGIAILSGIWLFRTTFGHHTLAIGSSVTAAQRSGVKTDSVTIHIYMLAGFMAGIAGFLDLTRFGTTALAGHETDMLQALAASIIGGTSLFGGRASMAGAIVASFIPITLLTGFVMMGLPPFYQYIAVGVILIAAMYVDGVRRGRLT